MPELAPAITTNCMSRAGSCCRNEPLWTSGSKPSSSIDIVPWGTVTCGNQSSGCQRRLIRRSVNTRTTVERTLIMLVGVTAFDPPAVRASIGSPTSM